ncbi:DUF692 family multinuclear iron-containing protein [Parafrankia sp. EUN1f]|uniref:multinuclear nonheme iron-dependent oxidase n=1 Tax=Parafrankia sp. EUN1f TaxID=102897 RepID=UPI0001C4706C|nr:DUF692 family multinuclear iron-containing protein [Parafrankia sp. EUN1f]EFC80322.1 protein of unknown function DUF692 [Parafrankia sp. EUN1f]
MKTPAVGDDGGRRQLSGLIPGLGAGWRPPLANVLAQRADLTFVEVIAEAVDPRAPLPPSLAGLAERGVPIVPHGIRLSLGSTERPQPARVARLAAVVQRCQAPLVSEHVAMVRAGGLEAGHLLPVPLTRQALGVVVGNVRAVTAELGVPLALEHPASLLRWPADDLHPADFLTELAERTDALLVLDVANLHADRHNHGLDPARFLDRLPWERIAYVHVAGGVEHDGRYHDTHRHPVPPAVLDLLAEAVRRCPHRLPVMLERDGDYPSAAGMNAELDAVAGVLSVASTPAPAPSARPGPPFPDSRQAAKPAGGANAAQQLDLAAEQPDPAAEQRDLAAEQADLVRGLVAGGPDPAAFDPARLAATRAALLDKRAREVAAVWPALARMPGFADRFARYAAGTPPHGPVADGRAFAEAARATLDIAAVAELLAHTLPGRPFAVRAGRAADGRAVAAVRLPGGAFRLLKLPRH